MLGLALTTIVVLAPNPQPVEAGVAKATHTESLPPASSVVDSDAEDAVSVRYVGIDALLERFRREDR